MISLYQKNQYFAVNDYKMHDKVKHSIFIFLTLEFSIKDILEMQIYI
jgi:hypothetical protein